MADTSILTSPNGDGSPDSQLSLPECIAMSTGDMAKVPSPGTQRALKAETGRDFDDLVGENADGADRIQTFIWMKLRREFPGLRWDQCADVEIEINQEQAAALDPTKRVASIPSLPSAASGA